MRFALSFFACSLVLQCFAAAASAAERPNVLFIAVDDLNDWTGCLGGHPQAKTPHIDALAARGVNFAKAYCACPVCNPSRTALMLGLRSSTTGVYSNGNNRRDSKIAMSVTPLNTYFHEQGYYVAGAGKIYHGDGDQFGEWDDYAEIRGGPATIATLIPALALVVPRVKGTTRGSSAQNAAVGGLVGGLIGSRIRRGTAEGD